MKRLLSRLLPALALLAFASPALAEPLNINANVVKACKVTEASADIDVNWNPVDATGETGTGTFHVRCTKGTDIYVSADGGVSGAALPFLRSVDSGAQKIGYTLELTTGSASTLLVNTDTLVEASQGKNTEVPVTFQVTLDTAAYDAVGGPDAGAYSDIVTVTFTAL